MGFEGYDGLVEVFNGMKAPQVFQCVQFSDADNFWLIRGRAKPEFSRSSMVSVSLAVTCRPSFEPAVDGRIMTNENGSGFISSRDFERYTKDGMLEILGGDISLCDSLDLNSFVFNLAYGGDFTHVKGSYIGGGGFVRGKYELELEKLKGDCDAMKAAELAKRAYMDGSLL